ncbi:MAG: hypothetical protein KZQ70_11730 [gamma proteobacterium symbiont of Lucinoma myriamae]|nr:hypothetical protein [gamma proteobacterium symbiont of Lucinoma myriamae]MCU7817835.1 hypothetical protein [gamma proteobacterium symbiont of Lucinoma myriamae]MCU7833105.1 hypothetical protein [gamma proteobacterium symbiont of Lucinoma myriamae]
MKLITLLISIVFLMPLTLVWSQSNKLAVEVPVILNGDQLAQFKGKEIQNLRVFSVKNGQASVIPFQIDQLDADGDWVWEVAQKNGITHDNEDSDNKKLFDHNDQLLFMTIDLGEKQSSLLPSGIRSKDVLQIQVKAPDSNETLGWVYIAYYLSKPPPLSPRRYMSYHPEQKKIQSPIYKMSYSNEFIAVMNQLSINGTEIVDRLKIRGKIKVGFLLFGGNINFNEEEVDGYPAGYINGPIRTIKRVVNYVKLGAGMHSPSLNCDHLYYPNHAEIPIMLSRSVGVKNMTLRIGLDFHGADFEHLYNDVTKEVQLLKDKDIDNRLMNFQTAQWMVLSGLSNSLFTSLRVPENIHHLVSISPYVIYNENLTDLPENFSGAEPESGFTVTTKKDFPSGEHLLYMTYALSTQSHTAGNGVKINNLLTEPLKTMVISMPGN